MVENAFQSILRIRRELRGAAGTEEGGAERKVEAECIICYDDIADTVLMPCKHLVLCMVCFFFFSFEFLVFGLRGGDADGGGA